ncbi:SH3 domain-containing protein [Candidatus Omnitrophota bacterium]
MVKKIVIHVVTIVFLCTGFAVAKEQFPFTARVTAEKVNVRAGYNINFEILDRLLKEQEVVVLDSKFGWHKVKLLQSASCYMSREYLEPVRKRQARVTANRVNVRAKPNLTSTVLCQVGKDTLVTVVEQEDKENKEWHSISPPLECSGWIFAKNLEFVSYEIKLPKPQAEVVVQTITQKAQESKQPAPGSQIQKEYVAPARKVSSQGLRANPLSKERLEEEGALFIATGIIKPRGKLFKRVRTYRLIKDKKLICYLQGEEAVLEKFVDHKVELVGSIVDTDSLRYPVVAVQDIALFGKSQ